MNNSSEQVFSFLINATQKIKNEDENFEGIFKLRPYHFKNAREFTKKLSKKIYNEIENNIYSYKDIFIFMLYKYALSEKVRLYDIKAANIKKVVKFFTKKQLKIDEDMLVNINKQVKFKSLNEFFEIRESGEPIIYELIKKNFITPVIFVKFFNEAKLTNEKKDVILKSKEYKRFEFAMKNIIKIIKGGFDE